MEDNAHNIKKIEWHTDILPKATKKALDFLSHQMWLKKSKWYLAGGTALALHEEHRESLDLNFFLPQKNFSLPNLLGHFSEDSWKIDVAQEKTIYGKLFNTKVSFIAYPFFVPKKKPHWYGNVRILDPQDIAVMKIIAISQRGRKRDFFDLFWYVKKYEALSEVFPRLPDQYPMIAHNYHHIIKSLSYFDDAELDPAPKIFFKATWKEVKNYFRNEAVSLARKLLHLE